jgi:integrase
MAKPRVSAECSVRLLSRLLGGQEKKVPRERYQTPKLKQTKSGVWYIRPWVDVLYADGSPGRAKKTITIGTMPKREAQAQANEVMKTINRAEYVITSQIKLKDFLDKEYCILHMDRLAASTRVKCRQLLAKHIRPAFGDRMLCEIDAATVQLWLNGKAQQRENGKPGLSSASRTDLRSLLSNIFNKAIEWGRWRDRNPIEFVHVGRKQVVWQQRKLTDEETMRLLAALPSVVRLLCSIGLFCTLRISEILGLQEKHLDFSTNQILIRQRNWRGDIDMPKNRTAARDVPMGYLADPLRKLCTGDPERFVFQIKTRNQKSICRDDREIARCYLLPAARALGVYWKGFGFHALRREAVTAVSAAVGVGQAMKLSGHSRADMSLLYTLKDNEVLDRAIRDRQEKLLGGMLTEKVN